MTASFLNMMNETFVTHGLPLVCETIKLDCSNIDNAIIRVKKVFLKAPYF
jgi:hypothetical protein